MLERARPVLSLLLAPLVGCDGSTEPPSPWPADGVTPAVGRYEYTFVAPAGGSAPGQRVTGPVEVRNATATGLSIVWDIPGYDAESRSSAAGAAYEAYVRHVPSGRMHFHTLRRPAGREELTCEGSVAVLGQPAVRQAAACAFEYVGP